MGVKEIIGNAWKVASFDDKTTDAVLKDSSSFKNGLIFLVLTAVVMSVGVGIFAIISGSFVLAIVEIIATILMLLFGFFVGGAVLHGLAHLFKGKGSITRFYGGYSHSYLPYWIGFFGFIPLLGLGLWVLAGLWHLILTINVVQKAYDLSLGRALIVVLIPVVIVGILILSMGVALLALFFAGTATGVA
ncbi:hypothetical protein CMO92_00915 [Candidatus Woesearchaeota archaeon]|nr:hypothetical protein [Candidatus Woesearchaeota archaeon]|tara:strand:- start:367 stop:933 length:567 start_codon:yes stop_codon:yes gene_type:complete